MSGNINLSSYVVGNTNSSCSKSGVPRPVTYGSLSQPAEVTNLLGRTGSHPTMAGNPSVLQPGLEPDVTSFRPGRARLYSQGLRKPSVGLPVEIL